MGIRRFLLSLVAVCVAATCATVAVASPDPSTRSDAIPLESGELRALAGDMQLLRESELTDAQVTDEDLDHTPVLPGDDVIDVEDARKVESKPGLLVAPTADGSGLCAAADGRMACGDAAVIAESGAAPAITWNVDGVHVFGFASDSRAVADGRLRRRLN